MSSSRVSGLVGMPQPAGQPSTGPTREGDHDPSERDGCSLVPGELHYGSEKMTL